MTTDGKLLQLQGIAIIASVSLLYSEGLPQVLLKADIGLALYPNSKSISSVKFRAQTAS